jgi:hypothetical protein
MSNTTTESHQARFAAWKQITHRIRTRTEALQKAQHEKGWELAASVGIPRCGCSLHNASIDDDMTGWCKGNPERLKVAKRAKHILDNWSASRLGARLIQRAWNRLVAKPSGWACYDMEKGGAQ